MSQSLTELQDVVAYLLPLVPAVGLDKIGSCSPVHTWLPRGKQRLEPNGPPDSSEIHQLGYFSPPPKWRLRRGKARGKHDICLMRKPFIATPGGAAFHPNNYQ